MLLQGRRRRRGGELLGWDAGRSADGRAAQALCGDEVRLDRRSGCAVPATKIREPVAREDVGSRRDGPDVRGESCGGLGENRR